MSLYGDYQIVKEIGWSNGATLHSARKGNGPEEYAVKVFSLAFFGFAGDDDTKAGDFSNLFNSRIENQKKAADQSPRFAPIFDQGFDNDSAWYVTRLFPNSVQKLIETKAVLTREEFYTLLHAIVQATLEFKKICGRSHGNVKATNILLAKPGKSALSEVILADAAPGTPSDNAVCELTDLRGIGQIIHRLVINEDREEEYWTLPPAPTLQEWVSTFGKDAEAWRSLCARLLEPDLTIQNYDVEELAFDLERLKPQPKVSPKQFAVIAGVVLVLGIGAVFALKQFSRRGNEVNAQSELRQKQFEEQATRLAHEKRALEERAAAEAKAREEALQKATAESKRLTEEKRLADARAATDAKKIEEARRQAQSAERARLEAERIAAERSAAEAAAASLAAETKAREAAIAQRQAAEQPVEASTARVKPLPGTPWSNTLEMHFVPLPNSKLLVCTWETRRKDFEQFVQLSKFHGDSSWRVAPFKQTAADPVVNVAPADAKTFCQWLTEYERSQNIISPGQTYRLPTDAEWSDAARVAGMSEGVKMFAWGPALPPPSGAGNYAQWCSYDRFQFTAPVAQFQPNALGLYDMAGNVWEICQSGSGYVGRGASWQTELPEQMNLMFRLPVANSERNQDLGFRCVLDCAAND